MRLILGLDPGLAATGWGVIVAEGNRLRRAGIVHDADAFSAEIDATVSTFTAPFLAVRRDGGCPAPDPIFIVGLPRSGSTLIEQILDPSIDFVVGVEAG